jgi:U3 small nucleolar RNA-associated protein 14
MLRLRQAQLAKMRSILFEQERKFKRIKKIKSKKYRQLRRRALERTKAKLTLEELKEIDPAAAGMSFIFTINFEFNHLKRE